MALDSTAPDIYDLIDTAQALHGRSPLGILFLSLRLYTIHCLSYRDFVFLVGRGCFDERIPFELDGV